MAKLIKACDCCYASGYFPEHMVCANSFEKYAKQGVKGCGFRIYDDGNGHGSFQCDRDNVKFPPHTAECCREIWDLAINKSMSGKMSDFVKTMKEIQRKFVMERDICNAKNISLSCYRDEIDYLFVQFGRIRINAPTDVELQSIIIEKLFSKVDNLERLELQYVRAPIKFNAPKLRSLVVIGSKCSISNKILNGLEELDVELQSQISFRIFDGPVLRNLRCLEIYSLVPIPYNIFLRTPNLTKLVLCFYYGDIPDISRLVRLQTISVGKIQSSEMLQQLCKMICRLPHLENIQIRLVDDFIPDMKIIEDSCREDQIKKINLSYD